ncbi:carbonic anhydrase 12 [Stigmatopora nigra]
MLSPVAFLLHLAVAYGAKWGYTSSDGERHWPRNFPYCAGPLQSPVDFKTAQVLFDASLPPIVLENYDLTGQNPLKVKNNGHTVQVGLPWTMGVSGLPGRYAAAQLHLHWGSKSNPGGSEHTVDGKRYAAELHIVHYNSAKYPKFSKAFDKSDGLAVLAVFIEVSVFLGRSFSLHLHPLAIIVQLYFQVGAHNPAFEKILSHLSQVKYKSQSWSIPAFDIRELMPERLDEYFRYDGSLTTPPCYQSVLWTVFRNPVAVSRAQYDTLTTTMFAGRAGRRPQVPLVNVFRKPLALDNRVVLTSFKQGVSRHKAVTCTLQRKATVRQLLAGEAEEVLENGLLSPSVSQALRRHTAPTPSKSHAPKLAGTPDKASQPPPATLKEVAEPTLDLAALLRQKSLEIQQSTTESKSLALSLARAVVPKLNLRSFLSCKSDMAVATVQYLLSGRPLWSEDEDLFPLDSYLG